MDKEKCRCVYCGKVLSRPTHARVHEKTCRKNPNVDIKCICKYCGLDAKKQGSLATHEPYCKLNPNRIHRIQPNRPTHYKHHKHHKHHKQKTNRTWVCKYCEKTFYNRKELFAHWKMCEEKLKIPVDSLGRTIDPEGHRKSVETIKRKIKSGEYIPKGHPLTEETRHKLSVARRTALNEGRGNHWVCPFIKRSYPEQYFFEAFKVRNVEVENNTWVCGRYCLDFLVGNKYFEVDGEQHYTEEGIRKDKERTEFLQEHGYALVGRCRWSRFMKLSQESKQEYIENIIRLLKE